MNSLHPMLGEFALPEAGLYAVYPLGRYTSLRAWAFVEYFQAYWKGLEV